MSNQVLPVDPPLSSDDEEDEALASIQARYQANLKIAQEKRKKSIPVGAPTKKATKKAKTTTPSNPPNAASIGTTAGNNITAPNAPAATAPIPPILLAKDKNGKYLSLTHGLLTQNHGVPPSEILKARVRATRLLIQQGQDAPEMPEILRAEPITDGVIQQNTATAGTQDQPTTTKKGRGRPKGSRNKNLRQESTTEDGSGASSSSSSNFTSTEDICITKAYINRSTDPTRGTNQKSDDFWCEILEKYEFFIDQERRRTGKEFPPRKYDSLRQRFLRRISPDSKAFNAAYVRVMKLQPSGSNADDCIHLALQEYTDAKVAFNTKNKKSVPKNFEFMEPWKLLQKMDNFNFNKQLAASLEEAVNNDGNGGHSVVASQGSGERPKGSKAAKAEEREAKMRAVQEHKSSTKAISVATGKMATNMGVLATTAESQRLDDKEASIISQLIAMGNMELATEMLLARTKKLQDEREAFESSKAKENEKQTSSGSSSQAGSDDGNIMPTSIAVVTDSSPQVSNDLSPGQNSSTPGNRELPGVGGEDEEEEELENNTPLLDSNHPFCKGLSEDQMIILRAIHNDECGQQTEDPHRTATL